MKKIKELIDCALTIAAQKQRWGINLIRVAILIIFEIGRASCRERV